MPIGVSDLWVNRWVTNVEWDFAFAIQTAWSLSGTTPIIDAEYNYRSTDIARNESILIKSINESDDFLGLGGHDYKRDFTVIITIRTSGDRYRKSALHAELKRILRTPNLWCGNTGTGYNNVIVRSTIDNVDSMRKMSELVLTVTCWRAEALGDING